MESTPEEEVDVGDIAERESISGYGLGAFGPTMGVPMPQGREITTLTDMEIAKALGVYGSAMESGQWAHQRDEYRKQHMAAQIQMANTASRNYATYVSAVGKQQERADKMAVAQAKLRAQADDPFFRAQNIYGKTGNLAAARTIAKTTGPALFQLGEQVDLGPNQMFAIRPVGDLDIPNQDGTSSKVPAWQFLRANGVNVVPYLGGDEEAKAFRSTAGKAGELMNTLAQIESLYANDDLKSMRGTETYRQLVQLEAGLSTIVQSIKTGSKSMAGVSDKEMEAIQASLPQSGTELLESTRSGLINVRNTRAQVLGILMRTARMNGVELVQLKSKDAPNSRRVTMPGSAPPGTTNPSNGKQSGSSTSGQPR